MMNWQRWIVFSNKATSLASVAVALAGFPRLLMPILSSPFVMATIPIWIVRAMLCNAYSRTLERAKSRAGVSFLDCESCSAYFADFVKSGCLPRISGALQATKAVSRFAWPKFFLTLFTDLLGSFHAFCHALFATVFAHLSRCRYKEYLATNSAHYPDLIFATLQATIL